MGQTIRIRRGNDAQIPVFQNGEFGLAQDTQRLFIGTPTGNVEFAKNGDLNAHKTDAASTTHLAHVKPDGSTITVDNSGTISAATQLGTTFYLYNNAWGGF